MGTMSQHKQTPGARLGTHRRTDQGYHFMGVAPEIPPVPLADRQAMASEFAPQKIPGPHQNETVLQQMKHLYPILFDLFGKFQDITPDRMKRGIE